MNKKFTKKQLSPHFGNKNKSIFPFGIKPELNNLKINYPKSANQELVLDLGKNMTNRFILYYGATKKKFKDYNKIKNHNNAYGDFKNSGIAKTNNEGKAILKFKCPQTYKEEGNTVIPHIHYIVANKGNKKWIEKLQVEHIVCNISHSELKEIIKKKNALILNALPIKYYIKDRIPMSMPLPHDLDLTTNEVKEYIKDLLPHIPNIYKEVRSGI